MLVEVMTFIKSSKVIVSGDLVKIAGFRNFKVKHKSAR